MQYLDPLFPAHVDHALYNSLTPIHSHLWEGVSPPDETTQRRKRLVRIEKSRSDVHCLSVCRAGVVLEVYYTVSTWYIVRHPHICTDISVDAELARDGHWISGRERDRWARVGGRCHTSNITSLDKKTYNSLVPLPGHPWEGCPPTFILRIDINITSLNQKPNNSLIPIPSCPLRTGTRQGISGLYLETFKAFCCYILCYMPHTVITLLAIDGTSVLNDFLVWEEWLRGWRMPSCVVIWWV